MAMSDDDLKALVAREISLADTDRKDLSDRRAKALEYYRGVMNDLPAEEGRSRVVSRDFADVLGWILPGIIRVFTASDRMALCAPVGDEDEEWARQATDGINHCFLKENDGYRVIHSATWDSLMSGNGLVKVWWDDTPKEVVSYHSGLLEDDFARLVMDDAVEVLAHSAEEAAVEGPDGSLIPIMTHSVKIKRTEKSGKVCIEAIPPEDYGIDGAAKECADARFQYHRTDKTRSDLIEMGFDRGLVESLGRKAESDTSEGIAREGRDAPEDGDPSMEVVDLYECYVRADVDNDGIAEMVRVYYAGHSGGGEVLDWDVWEDEGPFHDIPCDPMPHSWVGRSIFDETEDVQQIKTAMLRQANDNTYATNNPQRFVKGKIENPEELFSPSFGGAIFGHEGSEVTPLVVPFVANHAYDALNYQDQIVQRRTGVSRQTMALDPEALVNQSATANQNEKDASYSQIELLARNMAEFGWVKVFRAVLKLMVKHQDVAKTIRLNNKPVKIDPRWWNADMDVTINVGLGTGSRDRDAQMLSAVMAQQVGMIDRYVSVGAMDKAIEMLPYLHNAQVKFAEAVGLKNPESYYPDVDDETVAQLKQSAAERASQPDPKMQLEQAKAQASIEQERAKAQQAAIKEQAQLEADMQTKAADQQFEREKLALEYQFKQAELAQTREIELLKLGKTEMDTGEVDENGKPKRKTVDSTATMLMDGLNKLGEMIGGMQAAMAAPVEIVRGPDGKAMGTRRVLN